MYQIARWHTVAVSDSPGPSSGRGRFPGRVYRVGSDPDARFSLANERTFLAWIRTALALLAAGVALEALGVPDEQTVRLIAATTLAVLGGAAALVAYLRWVRSERAIRLRHGLPGQRFGLVLAIGLTVPAALVMITLIT